MAIGVTELHSWYRQKQALVDITVAIPSLSATALIGFLQERFIEMVEVFESSQGRKPEIM